MTLSEQEQLTVRPGLEAEWEEAVEANQDFYGHTIVEATVVCGKALDEGKSCEEAPSISAKAEGSISGLQAGAMASWIHHFHPRGEEFRQWWNLEHQIKDEGEKAN